MRTRVIVTVMVAVLCFYAWLIGWKGVAMIASGSLVGVMLGLAVLLVPVLGMLLVAREIQFGRATARLADALSVEGGLPVDDLPRRPSGRVDRTAADAAFAVRRREAEESPDDWRPWYRLALAYEDAGDRTRARAAARHAITLHDQPGS